MNGATDRHARAGEDSKGLPSPYERNLLAQHRTRWVILGLALVFLLLAAGQKAYRMTLPFDGWVEAVAPDNYTFARNALGRPSPLRVGDELLAVAGQDVTDWRRRALWGQLQRPARWRVGATVRYTVRRAGRIQDLAVRLYAWDPRLLLGWPTLQLLIQGVPLLALALFVFLKRPDDHAARLLLAFGVAQGMILLNYFDGLVPGPGLETAFAPAPVFWVARAISQELLSDLNLLTTYLALTFPVRRGPARTHPRAVVVALALLAVCWYPLYLLHLNALVAIEGALSLLGLLLLQVGVVLYNAVTLRDPVVRAQARWLGLGYVYSTAAFLVTFLCLFGFLPRAWADWPPLSVNGLVLAATLAVAILRYRLFAIDLILNRALVYGTLSAFVIGAYVAIVGYLGALFPAHNGLVPPLVATGLVAVLFQPLRERVQRWVNRLLYGERDDPYAVLARLGQRLESALASDELLPTIAETVGRALKLPRVAILLQHEGAFVLAAEYRAVPALPGAEVPAAPARVALPLVAHGDTVGELQLHLRPGEQELDPADRRLLGDLSRQAGIAAHAARLTADLRQLTVTLQQSRERLVATREDERRRLRRDLHDGLGPALASVTFKVEAARNLLRRDPARADALLASVAEQTQSTIADIRRLVYELAPPALDHLGLVAALRQHAAQLASGTRVGVEAPAALPALPAAVEVAAYRIALEATTNALRHAAARRCTIHLALEEGGGTDDAGAGAALVVTVEDDGRGVPERPHAGVGLAAMRERAAELGGACVVAPRPGGGTTVRARLPLEAGRAGPIAGSGPRVPAGTERDGEGEP